jgi:hypothetical protein
VIIIQLLNISLVESKNVVIDNVNPRRDINGNIMDVHDGTIQHWNGQYYYYGASYGLCKEPANTQNGCADVGIGNCGFRLDHNVSVWVSGDLSSWTPLGVAFQMTWNPTAGILFCPKVLFNKRSKQYVLWYNWLPSSDSTFAHSYYGVAVSSTPQGPFKVINQNVSTLAWVRERGREQK